MHSVTAHGASIPALGFGTWTLKGQACVDMTAEALRLGYRHVDTAPLYENEAAVGAAVRGSGLKRSDLFVTTKVWPTELASGKLEQSVERSIGLLDIGPADLVLVHWPNLAVPLGETIAALNRVRAQGLARNIGVSNFPAWLFAEAIALSDAPLSANQVEYHPYLDQSRVLSACRTNGTALISYCPLHRGRGLLDEPLVIETARRHGKTPAQVVLRWHVQQPGVIAIPRTTKRERLAENIAIFDFNLDEAEMTALHGLARPDGRLCNFPYPQGLHWD